MNPKFGGNALLEPAGWQSAPCLLPRRSYACAVGLSSSISELRLVGPFYVIALNIILTKKTRHFRFNVFL